MKLAYILLFAAACGEVSTKRPDASVSDSSTTDTAVDMAGDAATCVPAPAGLFGRWRAEQNATDSAGSYDGATQGANFSYGAGRVGDAFLFDGVDDAVVIDDDETMWPAASFSVEAWVRPTADGAVVSKYACGGDCPSGTSYAYWSLGVNGTGNATFNLRTDVATTFATVISPQVLTNGQWHHLVGLRDSAVGGLRLYVDGALAVSTTLPSDQTGALTDADVSPDPTTIGSAFMAGQTTVYELYTGAIDEVAYYTVALSAAHIAAVHAARDGLCP